MDGPCGAIAVGTGFAAPPAVDCDENVDLTELRVLPAEAGARIFGVRGASVLGRFGLQNGDTLVRVCGAPFARLEQLTEALRSPRGCAIELVRTGAPLEIDVAEACGAR